MKNYSPVGRFAKLFGAAGELYVTLKSNFPDDFNKVGPLFVKIDELMVPLFLSQFGRRGHRSAVLIIDDIDTKERAQEFIGLTMYMEESNTKVEEDDEQNSFIGLKVTINGEHEGVIEDFIDSPLNPLFSITINKMEVLIPATEEFISEFDQENNHIYFELPEGLLELNSEK